MKKFVILVFTIWFTALFASTAFAQSFSMEYAGKSVIVEHKKSDGKFSAEEVLKMREKIPELMDSFCKNKKCTSFDEKQIQFRLSYKEKVNTKKVVITPIQ